MESFLKEQLARSIFRFKKVGMSFQPELDVSIGEIVVMHKIAEGTPDADKKVCVSDIQCNMHITKPAVSQMLSSLEKKGYIIREIDINDRRKILVTLTPKGEKILEFMKEYFNKKLDEIITRLGEDNTKQLIELFNRFADISEEIKNESSQREAEK